MDIKQISTSSCETRYLVDGHVVRLNIIIGGSPLLQLEDWTFSERFPIKDTRWTIPSEEWAKNKCYPHQNPMDIQGPTYDVLPEGIKTLEDYVARTLPLWNLRRERFSQLPVGDYLHRSNFSCGISSRRILDKDTRTFVHFEAELQPLRFGSVVADSTVSSGRITGGDREFELAPDWWKRYALFISAITGSGRYHYEELTEEEFLQMKALLAEAVRDAGKPIVPPHGFLSRSKH